MIQSMSRKGKAPGKITPSGFPEGTHLAAAKAIGSTGARAHSFAAAVAVDVVDASMALTNPAASLSALRASGSPLLGVRIRSEIWALASMIVDDCDSPGIGPDDLALLLQMAIYFDRHMPL
jgi:hypothetical protein